MGIKEETLENLRVELSKASPISESLEQCTRHTDFTNVGDVVSRLNELLQHAVGLNTRVGVANFIVSLANAEGSVNLLREYAASLAVSLLHTIKTEDSQQCERRMLWL